MLLAVHGICIGLFVILGILFLKGKGAFLIAGYNTASKAEKAKIDERKLCRYMGKLMFALAGSWLIVALSTMFDAPWLLWLGIGLFLFMCIGGVIYINSGNRISK